MLKGWVVGDTVEQCFGITFSTFLRESQTSSTVTAMIFNMFGLTWCLTGPFMEPLVSEFGWRRVAFVGSIMLSFSTVSSAFVASPWVLIFTYSVLGGTGVGILLSISYTIVPYYFRKRRGLANGIIMASDCGGQLLGPPLIYYLQSEYTYSGSILILGGIVLNCCLGATVFHPIEWHLKTTTTKTENNKNVNESVGESSYRSVRKPMSSKSKWDILTSVIYSSVANLRILRSARAVIIAISAALTLTGYLNFMVIVPFAMQDSGFTLEEAAWTVSVSAICNMLTRIIVSSLTDTRFFNFRICYLIGNFTITTSMIKPDRCQPSPTELKQCHMIVHRLQRNSSCARSLSTQCNGTQSVPHYCQSVPDHCTPTASDLALCQIVVYPLQRNSRLLSTHCNGTQPEQHHSLPTATKLKMRHKIVYLQQRNSSCARSLSTNYNVTQAVVNHSVPTAMELKMCQIIVFLLPCFARSLSTQCNGAQAVTDRCLLTAMEIKLCQIIVYSLPRNSNCARSLSTHCNGPQPVPGYCLRTAKKLTLCHIIVYQMQRKSSCVRSLFTHCNGARALTDHCLPSPVELKLCHVFVYTLHRY
nr:uncharacterized protein LOC128698124 [Cherax quadricarinatus]